MLFKLIWILFFGLCRMLCKLAKKDDKDIIGFEEGSQLVQAEDTNMIVHPAHMACYRVEVIAAEPGAATGNRVVRTGYVPRQKYAVGLVISPSSSSSSSSSSPVLQVLPEEESSEPPAEKKKKDREGGFTAIVHVPGSCFMKKCRTFQESVMGRYLDLFI